MSDIHSPNLSAHLQKTDADEHCFSANIDSRESFSDMRLQAKFIGVLALEFRNISRFAGDHFYKNTKVK